MLIKLCGAENEFESLRSLLEYHDQMFIDLSSTITEKRALYRLISHSFGENEYNRP
jgi:hypothetical protein